MIIIPRLHTAYRPLEQNAFAQNVFIAARDGLGFI